MRNSTNNITTLISNTTTSIHYNITTTTRLVTNNTSRIRNVTNYFTGSSSNITNSLTNAGNITKSLQTTNTTNFHALPTIPASHSITWIIGIIVIGSFALAMILNFEKYVWKMLKTKFWLRNKSTFIQLPDAEKNECPLQYVVIDKCLEKSAPSEPVTAALHYMSENFSPHLRKRSYERPEPSHQHRRPST